VGTPGGLSIYDGAVWETYTTRNSGIPYNNIRDIFVAEDGVIWLGFGGGLVSFTYEEPNAVKDNSKPDVFGLLENYPNPFNPTTTIKFSISESGFTNLTIYNITGQKIRELISDNFDAGIHSVSWDGRDNYGDVVSSGIFFSRLEMGERVDFSKMMLVK